MTQQQGKPGLAIVTGATGGMGSATAAQLAAQGWSLILCDIDLGRLEQSAGALRAPGQQVDVLAGDIADPAFPARILATLGDRPIGALIHTAGLSPTMGDAVRIFSVNYDATVRLVNATRPRMAEGGCAVLISSSSAYLVNVPEIDAAIDQLSDEDDSASLMKFATKPEMAYPISKRAVIKLVARQAAAFGERKARIVSIAPGLIDTQMSRAEQAASPQMKVMLEKTPLGRLGTPDEIASVAIFLCSPGASFISGRDILVDGGMTAAVLGR
ncbi:SDR family oxidoreductase [Phenylobacterium sp. LjRoot225]|uniref:SDR family NAD(P)-dependent oxidoreductase n=1 Tax=Phenylobacterium sp. LjRoot225 TaxID=3342285 RepID=UPI003ECDB6BB